MSSEESVVWIIRVWNASLLQLLYETVTKNRWRYVGSSQVRLSAQWQQQYFIWIVSLKTTNSTTVSFVLFLYAHLMVGHLNGNVDCSRNGIQLFADRIPFPSPKWVSTDWKSKWILKTEMKNSGNKKYKGHLLWSITTTRLLLLQAHLTQRVQNAHLAPWLAGRFII